MRKLLVTCECGQQMQVPRSALGKMGMCPTCGKTTRISSENTSALPARSKKMKTKAAGSERPSRPSFQSSGSAAPHEDAKQRFGLAVDHYYAGRYGQALAVFDGLLKEFPDDSEIDRGREQCLAAIRGAKISGLLAHGEADPSPDVSMLNEGTVRRIVLEKLVGGSSDEVQLQAAELASKLLRLGAYSGHSRGAATESATPTTPSPDDVQSNGNGGGTISEAERSTESEDSEVRDS